MKKLLIMLATAIAVLVMPLSASAEGGFTTERYDVSVKVSENNVYSVTNTIKVNFYSERHGIYLYVPYGGKMTRVINGEQVTSRYRAKIKNMSVQGDDYETYTENGCTVFRIGNEDRTVIGEKTYVISYDYVMPDDGISSMDDFYFNVLPADWETTIEKSRITVDMPKSFSAENTFLYVGNDAYVAGEPGFTADGNSVTVRLKNFDPANGATVRIVLPEGYFTDELSYGWVNIAAIILPIAAAAIAAVLYVLFGRNKKLFPTVEFYPPEGTTSADVGYMIDGIIDNKDLISLLIYWADKGYIAIETCENNAFTLTRLRGLPMSATEYERTMFDGIFESGTVVPSSKLDDSFYKTLAKTKTQLGDSIKKRGFTAFTTASRVCRILACLLAGAPIGAFLALAGYAAASDITYFGAAAALVMMAVSFVYSITVQAKFGLKKSEYRAKIALCAVVTAAALAGTVIVGAVFDWIVPAAVAAVLTLVIMQLSAVMPTRKKQSREYLEKLLGLREFIRAAELERIEKLSEDDPEYFYHVLPYAYVFGLSDTWAKRFESIAVPPPQWYYGYNNNMFTTMLFMNSLNRSLNSANTVMASSPNSGGSGIGGSGFGGGFSGGGAGGGGGGSW